MMKRAALFLFLCVVAASVMAQQQQPAFDANANLKTGPDVGQKIPAFSAVDQTGRARNFDSLKGPKGLVLFFNRSVDW
jgi:cytochrome oxidase Cu insertion factor (SCO1/SenC/PrrC family)